MTKKLRVSDVVGIINKIAPFGYAEDWDNSGLQVGDPLSEVRKIMVSLDASSAVLDAAVANSCSLLLIHHPLIFRPIKRLAANDPCGALIFEAIRNGLSIVALHTNYDIAQGGVNDLLAESLGLSGVEPLQVTGSDELVKLCVYVPRGHEDPVMEALFRFSGIIGNYADCSFRTPGLGTFKPLAGSSPFIGKEGARSSVDEERLEVLLSKDDIDAAVSAMRKAHPYEEPAFDLYPVLNRGPVRGLGRIGYLSTETSLAQFALMAKELLGASGVRYVGDAGRMVKRVALCGGSGASLIRQAKFRGADLLLTGDVKYHEARDAESMGIALVDAGHFCTERLMVRGFAAQVEEECQSQGCPVEVVCFDGEQDPFVHV